MFDSQQLPIILSLIVSNWHLQLQGHDHDLSPAQLSYAPRMWGHGKVIPRCQIQSHTSTSTLPLYQLKLQLESAWTYLNVHKVVQHYLYFKVLNSGEVKPPPMKSISDPRFALPRLPPVLRSSVVPLVPTVNNRHNCDRGNIVTWCTQTQQDAVLLCLATWSAPQCRPGPRMGFICGEIQGRAD